MGGRLCGGAVRVGQGGLHSDAWKLLTLESEISHSPEDSFAFWGSLCLEPQSQDGSYPGNTSEPQVAS